MNHGEILNRGHDYRWLVCRTLLGSVLVLAAVLKLLSPPTPLAGNVHLYVTAAAILIEAALGVWFVLGNGQHRTWAVAFTLWAIFLIILQKDLWAHADSCGCFGTLRIRPWFTFALDLAVILILPFCRPGSHGTRIAVAPGRRRAVVLITAVCFVTVVFKVVKNEGQWSDHGMRVVDGVTIVEPEDLQNRPFLLGRYIDVGAQFEKGDWIILLYQNDCQRCRTAIVKYQAFARGRPDAAPPGLALVEVPPHSTTPNRSTQATTAVLSGRLSTQRDWFVVTPLAIRLHDGVVSKAVTGTAAESFEQL